MILDFLPDFVLRDRIRSATHFFVHNTDRDKQSQSTVSQMRTYGSQSITGIIWKSERDGFVVELFLEEIDFVEEYDHR